MLRTHTCGELKVSDKDKTVAICGWVSTIRDHGGVLFIDLRDRYGITQVLFNPKIDKLLHDEAQKLGNEYVIRIKGIVKERPQGTENKNISTGGIEIEASRLEVLNSAEPPIFEISDDSALSEDLRYKYRYLDLRRPRMQKSMLFRHKFFKATRDYMEGHDFMDVETPILTKSTPEGARDYLVPSRLAQGKFFALPQSPQLFKQILMVGGIDRYFQIAKCFRDEDLRADRQPEFTQLDIEMSFIEEEDIFSLIEGLLLKVFRDTLKVNLEIPFPRLSYAEAIKRFGTDKPDIRFGLELTDLTEIAGDCDFKVFKDASAAGIVKGLAIKDKGSFSRSRIDSLTEYVKTLGAKGLAYFKVENNKLTGPIAKFFDDQVQKAIMDKTGASDGDILFFIADEAKRANYILDDLRRKLAAEEKLIDKSIFKFLWITEFPLFAYNAEEKRWESEHHPFTAPHSDDIKGMEENLGRIRSRSYDIVLNGTEIGSGSIRIHNQDLQKRIFKIIGIDDASAEKKFGFLTKAFKYGAPPHGGIALGLDRLIAIITGCDSIRDVIAFPKTQRAVCMLTDAPSEVEKEQLNELGLKISAGSGPAIGGKK
ncbi:MAG: aspartate--tRNA ligase [Candidatus Omnitrophica bacterium]|nr:aspartate--tRNA ligase [Candidatus Omnitrophota bacterium]